MLKAVKHIGFLVHKSKHPDINKNMVIESDNVEFFEYNYSYKLVMNCLVEVLNDKMNQARIYIMMRIQGVVHIKERQHLLDQNFVTVSSRK